MPSPDAPDAPASLAAIGAKIDRRIAALLDAEVERWSAVDGQLREPLAYLREVVGAGGKRLRPAFCYWAFVGAGGDPDSEQVIDAGAALELLHTMAIVHDDVMDGSATRRGMDAVHTAFTSRHAADQLAGEGRRFGEGVAILVGDVAFVYADILMSGAPPPAQQVFDQLRLEVNAGQLLDLFGTARRDATPDQARRICQYKSGKYTIERPLHLGAALAGRLDELAEPLTAYGLPLGEAFQLRDDLLDAFGDPQRTGKPAGGDLREGKPTALFAIAKSRATKTDADLLANRFGKADLRPDEIKAIQSVFETTRARQEIEDLIDQLVDDALVAAARLPLTAELTELARYVSGRSS